MKASFLNLFRSKFFKSVFNLSSGTSIAYLVTIGISPILTRLFTPEQFGILQFFQSSIIISTPIVTGCFYYALVTEKSTIRIHALFKGVTILAVLSTILITAFSIIVFYFIDLLSNYLLLIVFGFPIILIANALVLTMDYLFIQSSNYTSISFSRIVRSGSSGLIQTSTGFAGYSSGLIYGFMIGKILTLIFYLWRMGSKKLLAIYKSQSQLIRTVLTENLKQPLYILPTTLVSSGATELVIFIIGSIFGGYELGLYSLAYRVISIPSLLIGTSIGDVFFKESSSMIQESRSIVLLTLKTWLILFGIAVIPMAALWLFGPEIVSFVFGVEWMVTGQITTILAPYILFSFMSSSTGKLFISLNQQNFSFYFSLLIFIARISGLFIGYYFGGFIFSISLMIAFHFVALCLFNLALFTQIFSYEKAISA